MPRLQSEYSSQFCCLRPKVGIPPACLTEPKFPPAARLQAFPRIPTLPLLTPSAPTSTCATALMGSTCSLRSAGRPTQYRESLLAPASETHTEPIWLITTLTKANGRLPSRASANRVLLATTSLWNIRLRPCHYSRRQAALPPLRGRRALHHYWPGRNQVPGGCFLFGWALMQRWRKLGPDSW